MIPTRKPIVEKLPNWEDIIYHPSCMLIVGARGRGKSTLGFKLLDIFHEKYKVGAYCTSLPKEYQKYLPDYIEVVDTIDESTDNSVVFADEASIRFHSYAWNSTDTKVMDRIVSLSRKKKLSIIFATHTARKFAVPLLLDMDALVFKKPSMLHARLERAEIRNLSSEASEFFRNISNKDQVKYSYVFFESYIGPIMNDMPEYWCDDLSEAYIDVDKEYDESTSDSPIDKYGDIIERIIDWENRNPKSYARELDPEADTYFEWHEIGINYRILHELVKCGVLKIIYKSNRTTYYRLNNRNKIEERISADGW